MVVTLIWHINYQHLSGLNVKLALAKRAYSVSRSRWKAEWISVEGKKLMWPRVAGGPSNKFAFHARSQERVASSWRRLTVNTSGHAWESVRRSSSLQGSIIITRGVSNFASFAREAEWSGHKGARILSGKLWCRIYSFTYEVNGQSVVNC